MNAVEGIAPIECTMIFLGVSAMLRLASHGLFEQSVSLDNHAGVVECEVIKVNAACLLSCLETLQEKFVPQGLQPSTSQSSQPCVSFR